MSRNRNYSESEVFDPDQCSDTLPLTSTPSPRLSVPNVHKMDSISPSPSLSISRIITSSTDANCPINNPTRNRIKAWGSSLGPRKLFQFLKKTGGSIKIRVVKVNNIASEKQYTRILRCGSKNCKCCKIVSVKSSFAHKDVIIKTTGGCCSSYNII